MDPYFLSGQVKDWAFILTFISLLAWIAYIVTTGLRRRQQNAMQKALLEKFASAHDFAEFMQSPAGQKYVLSVTEEVASPRNSIVSSVRIGIVLLFLGAGFIGITGGNKDAHFLSHAAGMVMVCLAAGFLFSALASYFLAKKIDAKVKE